MQNRRIKYIMSLISFAILVLIILYILGGMKKYEELQYFVNNSQTKTSEVVGIKGEILENGEIADEYILEQINENFIIGKNYQEMISVINTGSIDQYVRVIIKKSWLGENGDKDTSLDLEMIELNILESNGWMIDQDAGTSERIIAYYKYPIVVGEQTMPIIDSIKINSEVRNKYDIINNNGNIIMENKYNEKEFKIDIEANVIQTHSVVEAIKNIWGVDVTVSSDGVISLI